MYDGIKLFLEWVGYFFIAYLIGYSTFLFLSVVVGSLELYKHRRQEMFKSILPSDYYLPISIIVPAYNEEVTVVDTVRSLLTLEYRAYEIIVVDDGSKDRTSEVLAETFDMHLVHRPIRRQINCQREEYVYETRAQKVPVTLIRKKNGGKADALNMGINAANFPYFICMDADSVLQYDSLRRIAQPILENGNVVAVGGIVRISNDVELENGRVKRYRLPRSILAFMQVLEYDRSFLASRILFDRFNGSLIISGAFGLFKKDTVIAVFSNNLKYILACSSLSQIGFILVGTAALSLLGQHNALAAHGTVLYMMNHSLVKLTLFLLAGVVYCNTHALDLNQIRGFGRGKPLLHILFLCGACSLAGIPGFLGYISKTLVHESLVELAAESGSLGVTAVEWLFLFSGGLTAAYLTKIYAALFWQKPAASTGRTWGTPATTAALILAALPLPVLGLLPHVLAEPVAALALPFVGGHPFGHAVHYLAWENLKGVAISLTIGMAVYFLFIRLVLMDRREGQVVYLERWPRWLSLEDRVYRPAIRGLYRLLNVVLRAVCDALDFLVLLARRTFLRDSRPRRRKSPRSAVLHAMTHGGQRTEQEAADRLGTILDTIRRMEGSLSYALLMACLGLCIVLVCILLYVF